jgi:Rad3-related DNA helicase
MSAQKGLFTIVDAARALAACCDGAISRDNAGFNGADAPFAASLLSQTWLSEKQLSAMHRMLGKYTKQLERLGFQYHELEIPRPGPVKGAKQSEFTWTKGKTQDGVTPLVGGFNQAPATPAPARPAPAPKPAVPAPKAPEPWTPRLAWTMSAAELLAHFPQGMTPRPKQLDALTRINEAFRSGKRIVVLEMPTGGGKSPICMTAARAVRAMDGQTSFLTVQKSLQDQYTRDFPAPEIEVLKGRANYPCSLSGGNCGSDAPCKKAKKGILPECVKGGGSCDAPNKDVMRAAVQLQLPAESHLCPYWNQLQKCHDSAITLFNFSSFLFQQRIKRFGKRDLMLIDEAHKIEGQIMSFVTVELEQYALNILGVELDDTIRTKEQLLTWLRDNRILERLQKALDNKKDKTDPEAVADDLDQMQTELLENLQMKLQIFMGAVDKSEWVFEVQKYFRFKQESKKLVARPLFGKDFAQDLLFSKGDRALVMSATILDVKLWARNLGFDPSEVALVQTACDFPVANRPIHLEYCGSMGYKYFSREQNPKDPTEPKFVKKVAQILERHQGQRGLIHCQSHALAKLIRENVQNDRLLFQDDFENKDALFAAHDSRPDSVIVSPGIKEGFDFKNDRARFQIIAKVPFASMTDLVVKERMNRQPEWYGWLAALDLVQSYGRIVRSAEDWGTTYIVDSGFEGFCARNGNLLPVWFREAFRKGAPREVRR